MILQKLGVYGWTKKDENLVIASLLTGDPLLLIGNHGCAKTHVANKVAQALGRKFLVYDASKAMFEDVLGYPNVEKLKECVVEYVPSLVTVWDKELILIDELNRAIPELQSKWLEIIRSRKITGLSTKVKWVWAAMNLMSYSATRAQSPDKFRQERGSRSDRAFLTATLWALGDGHGSHQQCEPALGFDCDSYGQLGTM